MRPNTNTSLDDSASATAGLLREKPHSSLEDYPAGVVLIKNEKPCNECGRPAPYVLTYPGKKYGWRLCFEHLGDRGISNLKTRYATPDGDRFLSSTSKSFRRF